jgi:uncharacterized protein
MTADADIELAYDKPRPVPDERSAPFFEATVRGELLLQHCGACGRWMWPVRFRCIDCMSGDVVWRPASGRGTVYTFTVIHQLFHPGFAAEVPYNVAVIDLDEGVRCYSTVVGVANDDLRIGDHVEVVFERISAEFALPKFRIRTD